jgi:hypothetical protein
MCLRHCGSDLLNCRTRGDGASCAEGVSAMTVVAHGAALAVAAAVAVTVLKVCHHTKRAQQHNSEKGGIALFQILCQLPAPL